MSGNVSPQKSEVPPLFDAQSSHPISIWSTTPALAAVSNPVDEHNLPFFSLDDTFASMQPISSMQLLSLDDDQQPVLEFEQNTSQHSTSESSSSSANTGPRQLQLTVNSVATPVNICETVLPDLNKPPPNWIDPRDDADVPWNPTNQTITLLELLAISAANQQQSFFSEPTTTVHEEESRMLSGHPDIVATGDDLKELLLAPYNQLPLALFAHRIGPSVILDGGGLTGCKTVKESRKKTLRSKLLYYSILADESSGKSSESKKQPHPSSPHPTPTEGGNATSPTNENSFTPLKAQVRRALHWKFDDLSVLIGSGNPILRHKTTGEEMTLQVHDETAYLSQLESLEFWLDNVITNVQKVAICFHNDGVVQGYQVVNTKDIPDLSNAHFEPIAIQQKANKLLHWLKKTCTKEGGSYVVLKDPRSSEIQVYDLSELHAKKQQQRKASNLAPIEVDVSEQEKSQTTKPQVTASSTVPRQLEMFSYPLAMMSYRMAQCLVNSDAECLRLLQKCIHLLDENDLTFALMLTSCHVQCAQHYHSSSPLPDSEGSCKMHLDKAVFSSAKFFGWIKKECPPERVKLIDEAKSISLLILRCLCSLSLQHTKARNYIDFVDCFALIQCVLLLRRGDVPLGFLLPKSASTTSDSPSSRRSNEPDIVSDTTTPIEQSENKQETELFYRKQRILQLELAACIAAVEMIAGDFQHFLLQDVYESMNTTEPMRIQLQFKKAEQALRRHTPLYGKVLALANDNEEIPDRLNYMEKLDPITVDVDVLYQRGIGMYQRAMVHNTSLHHDNREIRRKLGGIHSQYALICSVRADTPEFRPTDRRSPLLQQSLDAYLQARQYFEDVIDPDNILMMSANIAKLQMKLGECSFTSINVYSSDERRFLESALELAAYVKKYPKHTSSPAAKSTMTTVYQAVSARTCALLQFSRSSLTIEKVDELVQSIQRYSTSAVELLKTTEPRNVMREASIIFKLADAHFFAAGIHWSTKFNVQVENDGMSLEMRSAHVKQAITRYRQCLPQLLSQLSLLYIKSLLRVFDCYFFLHGKATKSSAGTAQFTNDTEEVRTDLMEKMLTMLCESSGWIEYHTRSGSPNHQQQFSAEVIPSEQLTDSLEEFHSRLVSILMVLAKFVAGTNSEKVIRSALAECLRNPNDATAILKVLSTIVELMGRNRKKPIH